LAACSVALPAVSRVHRTDIVPYAVGGVTSVVGQIVAERMRKALGQPIIIENVGRADGSIGTGRASTVGYLMPSPIAPSTSGYPITTNSPLTLLLFNRLDGHTIVEVNPHVQEGIHGIVDLHDDPAAGHELVFNNEVRIRDGVKIPMVADQLND
jgi:hypothetical protein